MLGYAQKCYAAAFEEVGTPIELPRCGGWLLRRAIPGSDAFDACGPYPYFSCADWGDFAADLAELDESLVSVAMVLDPCADYDRAALQRVFRDRFASFKEHYVVDLRRVPETFVSKHHRYYARRALRDLSVEVSTRPADFLDEWHDLYEQLARRHSIAGLRRFSRDSFAAQLAVPGMTILRAVQDGRTVAAHLFVIQDRVVHSHLAAASQQGYRAMAAYAIHWRALEIFRADSDWLNLGGAAGVRTADGDGLTRFKRGFASETRPVHFAGRVLDRARYDALAKEGSPQSNGARSGAGTADGVGDYFPAYRRGEFA